MLFDPNSNALIELLATGLHSRQNFAKSDSLDLLAQGLQTPDGRPLGRLGVERGSHLRVELDRTQVALWGQEILIALSWIRKNTPVFSKRIALLVRELIPLKTPPICPLGRGLSSIHRFGSIFVGLPRSNNRLLDRVQLILNLAHETGHQTLILLQASDRIVLDPDQVAYSPIRRTERPVIRALHANAALSAMLLLIDEISARSQGSAQDEVSEVLLDRRTSLEHDLSLGLGSLFKTALSPLGRAVCRQFTEQLGTRAA